MASVQDMVGRQGVRETDLVLEACSNCERHFATAICSGCDESVCPLCSISTPSAYRLCEPCVKQAFGFIDLA